MLASCQHATATDTAAPSAAKTEDTPLINQPPAGFGEPDVTFAHAMILHDQQAVELAATAPGRATNPELLALARRLSDELGTELSTLKVFALQWNDDVDGETSPANAAARGPLDDATMARIATLTGSEFASTWLQSMVTLHKGTIRIAEAETTAGSNVDAIALAKRAVISRQADVDQMKTLLAQPVP
jgi:uncharacterized protein (DUF305 family)